MSKESASAAALRLLSRKSYFTEELAKKLQQKGYSPEEIEPIITRLKKEGYLDDHLQMQRVLTSKKAKGYGPAAIRWQLKEKTCASFEMSIAEEENSIRALLQKKAPDWKNLPFVEKRKLQAFLQRRGFSFEAILKVCGQNFDDSL